MLRNEQKLKKYIHFSDEFSEDPLETEKIRNAYSDMIGQIISESLFLFNDDYYGAKIELVQYDMMNIEYCIDLDHNRPFGFAKPSGESYKC